VGGEHSREGNHGEVYHTNNLIDECGIRNGEWEGKVECRMRNWCKSRNRNINKELSKRNG